MTLSVVPILSLLLEIVPCNVRNKGFAQRRFVA